MNITTYTKSAFIEKFGHFFWHSVYNTPFLNLYEKFDFNNLDQKKYIDLYKNMIDLLVGKFKNTAVFELREQLGQNLKLKEKDNYFESTEDFEKKFILPLIDAIKYNFEELNKRNADFSDFAPFELLVKNLNKDNISDLLTFKTILISDKCYDVPDYLTDIFDKKDISVFYRNFGLCQAKMVSFTAEDNFTDLNLHFSVNLPDDKKKEISIYTGTNKTPESPFNDSDYTFSKERFIQMTKYDLAEVNKKKQNLLNLIEQYR